MAKTNKHASRNKEPVKGAPDSLARSTGYDWFKSLLIAICLALLIRWTIGEPFRIPSGSMEPTLQGDPRMFHGDRVFVNKLAFGIRYPLNHARIPIIGKYIHYADSRIWRRADPQRWDIVVFKTVEANSPHATLVKRVVGLPGERVQIADGKVFVNGEPLELPDDMPDVTYTSQSRSIEPMRYGVLPQDEFSLVPKDSYLLLGDNSGSSRDGRYFGWVPHEHILGRVSSIWWPVGHWRDFTGFSDTWWWKTLISVIVILTVFRVFIGRSWRGHDWTAGPGAKRVHYFINRWSIGIPIPLTPWFLVRWPLRRGTLVFYHSPKDQRGVPPLLVGRVAALPEERVSFSDGRFRVNNGPVDDSAVLAERVYAEGEATGPFGRAKGRDYTQVPPNHVFVLTEDPHPEAYFDSRTLGWVPIKNITGAADAIWWPLARTRKVHR